MKEKSVFNVWVMLFYFKTTIPGEGRETAWALPPLKLISGL